MTRITLAGLARDVDGCLRFKRALVIGIEKTEEMLRSFQRFAERRAMTPQRS